MDKKYSQHHYGKIDLSQDIYFKTLLKDHSNIDATVFSEEANELDNLWNYYSIDHEGEITHLSIVGYSNLDLEIIFSLKNLQILVLRDCNIRTIPSSISNLKSLYKLDLSRNSIKELPDEITKLTNLDEIRVNHNRLKNLPNDFGNLSELVWCYLNDNNLTTLPSSFRKLEIIDRLKLSNNKLSTLPDEFGALDSLVELYLKNNLLTELPTSMVSLENIDILTLEGNRFSIDIDDLYGMPSIDIIRYIIKSSLTKTTTLNEFKLIVVGDERVGKTSIINRLLYNTYSNNCQSTEGIDIINGTKIGDNVVNIWDFAGQEITHQTHQFFLSKRSLYFLVIDAQSEDNAFQIYNWLSTIKTFAGDDSPIVIIVNKIDCNKSYIFDEELYNSEFNIVNVIYSSAKNNSFQKNNGDFINLNKLVNETSKKIAGLDFLIPINWLDIKNHIESDCYVDKDIMELGEFENLCIDRNVSNFSDQKLLLSLLNQIGTVVAYVEHERLNIIQIINPTWLTNSVYKIIRSEKIDIDGIIDKVVLDNIFCNQNHFKPRYIRWLMDLLIKFKLAFEIKNGKLLIPSKVNSNQPIYDKKSYNGGFSHRFKYHNPLRRTILSQLIVGLNDLIDEKSPSYWKRGVFIRNKKSKAVIVSDEFNNTIDVDISGQCLSSIELRSKIINILKEINSDKYHVDELVAIKENGVTLGYQDYDFLEDLTHNGIEEHIVPVRDPITNKKSSKKINIKQLLFGSHIEERDSFSHDSLTSNIISSLLLMTESRKVIFHEKENLINTRLRDSLLNRGYLVSDQSLGGESLSGESEGERDIVIRSQNKESKSIIEGLCLSNCQKSIIDEHIYKLINKYDTVGNKINYIVVYSKAKNFDGLCKKYYSYISKKFDCQWHIMDVADEINFRKIESRIENKKIRKSFTS